MDSPEAGRRQLKQLPRSIFREIQAEATRGRPVPDPALAPAGVAYAQRMQRWCIAGTLLWGGLYLFVSIVSGRWAAGWWFGLFTLCFAVTWGQFRRVEGRYREIIGSDHEDTQTPSISNFD